MTEKTKRAPVATLRLEKDHRREQEKYRESTEGSRKSTELSPDLTSIYIMKARHQLRED